jgi:hypothetical protein
MDGVMYNSQNTGKRKGANDEAYAEGWDRIFGNKDKPIEELSNTLSDDSTIQPTNKDT